MTVGISGALGIANLQTAGGLGSLVGGALHRTFGGGVGFPMLLALMLLGLHLAGQGAWAAMREPMPMAARPGGGGSALDAPSRRVSGATFVDDGDPTADERTLAVTQAMESIKFGTSGWRAIIAEEFTFDNVRRVSLAIAETLVAAGLSPRGVVVGYDTRFLSESFAAEAARALASRGIRCVVSRGPIPTPAVAHAIRHHGFGGAINITASHNPAEYNGLKFSTEQGAPSPLPPTAQVEQRTAAMPESPTITLTADQKALITPGDFLEPYLAQLDTLVRFDLIREAGVTVGLDPRWGVARGWYDTALRRHATVSGPQTIRFESGSVTVSGNYTTSGRNELTGGTLTFEGTAGTIGDLRVSGGNLVVNGAPKANGTFAWTGGKISGTGTLTSTGSATVSTNNVFLDGATLENAGSMSWSGTTIYTSNDGTLRNAAAGTLELAGAVTLSVYIQGPAKLDNEGTLIVAAGTGTATFAGGTQLALALRIL